MRGEFIIRWRITSDGGFIRIGGFNLYWHEAPPSFAARRHGMALRLLGYTVGLRRA